MVKSTYDTENGRGLNVLKIRAWLKVMCSHYSWDVLKLVSVILHLRTVFHLCSKNGLWMCSKKRRGLNELGSKQNCFLNLRPRLQIFRDAFRRNLKPQPQTFSSLLPRSSLTWKAFSSRAVLYSERCHLRNKSSVILARLIARLKSLSVDLLFSDTLMAVNSDVTAE